MESFSERTLVDRAVGLADELVAHADFHRRVLLAQKLRSENMPIQFRCGTRLDPQVGWSLERKAERNNSQAAFRSITGVRPRTTISSNCSRVKEAASKVGTLGRLFCSDGLR